MLKKNWLCAHIHWFVTILLTIQPLMDVASYWLQHFGLSTAPILLVRMGLLGITVLAAFVLSDRKKVYWIAAGIIGFILAGHIFACLQVGYADPVSDLTNFIRVAQMPLTVLCLITFLRCHQDGFDKMQLGLTLSVLIMLAVEILSTLTGTDPHTYSDGKGILGWFFNTNSQSSNLSVLIPISLGWQLCQKKRRPVLFWLTAALGLTALYLFGTRLAYLGLMVIAVGLCVSIFIAQRKDWKTAVAMALIAVLFVVLMPHSPMIKHMNSSNSVQDQRQEWLEGKLGDDTESIQQLIDKNNTNKDKEEQDPQTGSTTPSEEVEENAGLSEEERQKLIQDLTEVYEFYVPDFVAIFGAEETMEMYNYSFDVRDFSAIRPKKLMFAKMLMNDSPFSARLFGLELSRFTVGSNIYDVENDFHGIYYLYGWFGLAAYLLFLAYFVGLIIWALLKKFKRYFTLEAAGYGMAFMMCLAHAYNTAGVLRRPNASIYLSAILAGIYYLVRIRRYPDEKEISGTEATPQN